MTVSVVLVHGLRTSASMWRGQVEALERAGHEAIPLDLPGHGSRMPERFTLAGAVETIDDAVQRARHPVLLCGFSLGAYLSIHYAGMSQRPIRGVLAASCGTQPYRVFLDGWRVAAAIIHRFPDRGLGLHNWAVRLAVRDPQRAHDVVAGGVALEVMQDVLIELRQLKPLASLSRIRQPVWFVNGTLDHFRFEERRYAAITPDGRLLHVRGATHMVSLTRPAEFDRILFDTIAAIAPTPPTLVT